MHLSVLDDVDDASESDVDSESSYTISTPSDNELENMSPVGTLRPDGKLAPSGGRIVTPVRDHSSPQAENNDLYFTPQLNLPAKSVTDSNSNAQPISKQDSSSKSSAQTKQPISRRIAGQVTNPVYDRVFLGDECITGITPNLRQTAAEDNSIYMTPCGAGKNYLH